MKTKLCLIAILFTLAAQMFAQEKPPAETGNGKGVVQKFSEYEERIKLAEELMLKGKFPEAEAIFKLALESNKLDSRVYIGLAGLELNKAGELKKSNPNDYLRRMNQALEYLNKALDINPKSGTVFAGFGLMHYLREEFETAEGYYQYAIKLHPENGAWWNSLGLTYTARGQDAKALPAYLKSVEFMPDVISYRIKLAQCYVRLRNFDEAMSAFASALKRDPLNDEARFSVGILAARNGDTETAKFHLSILEQNNSPYAARLVKAMNSVKSSK